MNSPINKNYKGSPYNTTKVISYLLSDTTIFKHESTKKKSEKIKASLTVTQKKLKIQQIVTTKARHLLKIQSKWDKIISREIETYNSHTAYENQAAITIQRILKGCIVRSKYTNLIIHLKEFKTNTEIYSLRTQTDMCMLTLGINTVPVIFI